MRKFGNESLSRSCQASWFCKHDWLHYDRRADVVFCFICKGICTSSKRDPCFSKVGFSNWRKASQKFMDHEKSHSHRVASEKIMHMRHRQPIIGMLSDVAKQQQDIGRKFLNVLFCSIRFLGKKGLPFQGDKHRQGVLYDLMVERCEDDADLLCRVKKRDNWLSDQIQNEIIEMYAHIIQRTIASKVSSSVFFGLCADGTTDISGHEQVSISVQYADTDLIVHNDFLGFYNPTDTKAETLTSIITDALLRLQLPLSNLVGYCFDGASNMSGRISGVQARLKEHCTDAIYVHCSNHSLDLVLQEAAREISLVANTLNFIRDTANVINESHKRKTLYQSMFGCKDAIQTLHGLCPTRWCVRVSYLKKMKVAYDAVLATLKELHENKSDVRADVRAKITGLLKIALKAEMYFGILVCLEVFTPCEIVASEFQGVGVTAAGVLESTNVLISKMKSLRSDDVFERLFSDTEEVVNLHGLKLCTQAQQRITQAPSRYRNVTTNSTHKDSNVDEDQHASTKSKWRREYYGVLDLVTEELKRRFKQSGLFIAAKREQFLINAASSISVSDSPYQVDLQVRLYILFLFCK